MDVSENDDLGDIDADHSAKAELSFEVDSDVDVDTYTMEIFVDVKDEHGAKHGQKYTLDLEVERDDHDLKIKSASLSASEVSCTRGSNSVRLELRKKITQEIDLAL